jgi:hypothetical protein
MWKVENTWNGYRARLQVKVQGRNHTVRGPRRANKRLCSRDVKLFVRWTKDYRGDQLVKEALAIVADLEHAEREIQRQDEEWARNFGRWGHAIADDTLPDGRIVLRFNKSPKKIFERLGVLALSGRIRTMRLARATAAGPRAYFLCL